MHNIRKAVNVSADESSMSHQLLGLGLATRAIGAADQLLATVVPTPNEHQQEDKNVSKPAGLLSDGRRAPGRWRNGKLRYHDQCMVKAWTAAAIPLTTGR